MIKGLTVGDFIRESVKQSLPKFDLSGRVTIDINRNYRYIIENGDVVLLHTISLAYDDTYAKDLYRFQSRALFLEKIQALAQQIDEAGLNLVGYSSLEIGNITDLPDGGISQEIIITEVIYQRSVI